MLAFAALRPGTSIPQRATEGAAGYDVYASVACDIPPGTRKLVDTGVAVALPAGHVGLLKTRSSMASVGVDVVAGVIDEDYRGEVKVLLHNTSAESYTVRAGARVAQMVVVPVFQKSPVYQATLDVTARGAGAFGSTGV